MRRVPCNQTKKISCNNCPGRCLNDAPSLLTLNNPCTLYSKTNSEDNKLNKANVHTYEECRQFTTMKFNYESPESKENENMKSKPILLERNMNSVQNKRINSKKTRQKPEKISNDVICNDQENCENEFPGSRKNRKYCKSELVKDKTQKIKTAEKCVNKKNTSGEIVKQVSNKQNLIHNDRKSNFINGKETCTIKSNFQDALMALENIPVRRSTRQQRKQNNDKSKTKYRKVFNNVVNRYKKYKNSEDVQHERSYNIRNCQPVSSNIPMKENCPKLKCNIMSPIRESISESCCSLKHTPREQQIHVPLYKNETVKCNIPEDRLAIYDFEYDENEEPSIKKKRKKRVYNKKPKLCSQNLTINKIKFGSTSSLNSTKSKFGSTSSINSANSEFNYLNNEKKTQIKNKPTDSVCELNKINYICSSNKRMSQGFEITPKLNFSLNGTDDSKKLFATYSPLYNHTSLVIKSSQKNDINNVSCNEHNIDCTNTYCAKNELHNTTLTHKLGKLDCSKLQCTDCCSKNNISFGSIHDTSSVSTEGMNFSTPCKQRCNIAYSNSIFDEHESVNSPVWSEKRYDEQTVSSEECDTSSFFGFDTNDEIIEKPVLSSVKKNVESSKGMSMVSCKREIFPANSMSIQDIIQVLQSEVNQKQQSDSEVKLTENSESCETDISLSVLTDDENPVFFRKPPRRSYERTRHNWEQEDADEEEKTVEEEVEEVLETEAKKHHRKKAAKSHVEEEAEKLAAKLNCQFKEIDKFNLCVE